MGRAGEGRPRRKATLSEFRHFEPKPPTAPAKRAGTGGMSGAYVLGRRRGGHPAARRPLREDDTVGPVGVFRTADDRILAVDNRCPHRGGPLSEGIVHGTDVTCPLHNTVVSLETRRDYRGRTRGAVA